MMCVSCFFMSVLWCDDDFFARWRKDDDFMTKISLNHGNSDKMTAYLQYNSKNFIILRQDIRKTRHPVISSSCHVNSWTAHVNFHVSFLCQPCGLCKDVYFTYTLFQKKIKKTEKDIRKVYISCILTFYVHSCVPLGVPFSAQPI